MKKFLLSAILAAVFSQSVLADYEIFTNQSEPFSSAQIVKKEAVYFGELQDYRKSLEEIQKSMALHGVNGALEGLSNQSANLAKGLIGEGLKGAGAGLGIGLLIGALDPFVMSFYADQQFVKVYKVQLKDGRTVFMNKFFVGDKHPEYSKEEIQTILGGTK